MKKKIFGVTVCVILMIIIAGYGIMRLSHTTPGGEDDEILTTKEVDPDKTMITIRVEYSAGQQENLEEILEEKFPDVDFVLIHDGSTSSNYTLKANLSAGVECDLIFSRTLPYLGDEASQYLLDLSSEGFIDSYYQSALESCAGSDGSIYYLPGPSDVYGIVYDKTMFDENGWEVPQSYSEFVSLIKTIKRKNVEPFAVSLMYPDMFQIIFNTYGYESVYAGTANAQWLMAYQNGQESMLGHMEPAVASFETLFWDGILTTDALDLSPSERSEMLYRDHTTAMIIECQNALSYERQMLSSGDDESTDNDKSGSSKSTSAKRGKGENTKHESTEKKTAAASAVEDHDIAMMPFWTSDDPDSDYVYEIPSYYMAINKASADESEEKKQLLLEVYEYLSSVEGQETLIGNEFQVSNIKGVEMNDTDFSEGIRSTMDKGNIISTFTLAKGEDNKQVERNMLAGITDLMQGKIGVSTWLISADTVRDAFLSGELESENEVYGTATETLTRLETAYTVAEMYRDETGADVGIVLGGSWNYSTNGYIYEGDITDNSIESLIPNKESASDAEFTDDKIVTTTLTGQQILDILNYSAVDTGTTKGLYPYYVAAGLDVKFAPWAYSGERVISCKTSDGKDIDTEAKYKVAYFNGSLPESIECEPELVLNMSWKEALVRWIEDNGGTVSKPEMELKLVYD